VKAKAKNKGTCQWCGSIQKLPSGFLAQHGYTVEHSFFEGVCMGSDHPPLEESCELVKLSITRAQDRIKNLRLQIEELQQPAESPQAWVRCYASGKGYFWSIVDLLSLTHYKIGEDKQQRLAVNEYRGNDILELAGFLNKKRGTAIILIISQIEGYILSQQRAVDSWKLLPLITL